MIEHLALGGGTTIATSIDAAREHIAQVFRSHALTPLGRVCTLDFRHRHASLGPLSFNDLQYGAAVTVEAPALGDFYLLQFTLRGACEIACGRDSVVLPRGRMLVMNPTRPYAKRWSADCRQLIVRLDKALIDRVLAAAGAASGPHMSEGVAFAFAASDARGASITRLVAALCADLADGGAFMHEAVRAPIAQSLAGLLLATLDHSHRAVLDRPASPASPHFVRRAEAYIRAHSADPLTPAAIARAAGVSARTLHRGFRAFRDSTPMAALRAARLDAARRALVSGGAASVTDAASACGFAHLSRFARDYRRRFGEAPARTLRGAS